MPCGVDCTYTRRCLKLITCPITSSRGHYDPPLSTSLDTCTHPRSRAADALQARRALLAPEADAGPRAVSLLVRLPDGRRLAARRFCEDATVGAVYGYVDVALDELALNDPTPIQLITVPAATAAGADDALMLRGDGGPARALRDYVLYTARPAQALAQVRLRDVTKHAGRLCCDKYLNHSACPGFLSTHSNLPIAARANAHCHEFSPPAGLVARQWST